MREIGKIKWFGGFNPKIQKLVDYGYIVRENMPDLYVNKNHLHCKVKELKPETIVTFELGVNFKNEREQALKVNLLKNEKEEVIKEIIYRNDGEFYKSLSVQQQVILAARLGDDNLAELWRSLESTVKLLILFKLTKEERELSSLVERLPEKDMLIRALLIIAWIKGNPDKKDIAYQKVYQLISKCLVHIAEDKNGREIIKKALPGIGKYLVDKEKQWDEWTILEYLEYYNGRSLENEIDEENRTIIKIISVIRNLIIAVN